MKKIIGAFCLMNTLFISPTAVADTYHVEKWGADSPTCGASTDPCESIQQAINNAGINEKVEVGPGTYTEDVNVNKDGLKVRSVAGRYATTIIGFTTSDWAVLIGASNVQFGKKGNAFTVMGATDTGGFGLEIANKILGNIKIEGNRFENNFEGIMVRGDNHQVRYNRFENNTNIGLRVDSCNNVLIENNEVFANGGVGISVNFVEFSSIIGNLASKNGNTGILLSGSSPNNIVKDNVSDDHSSGWGIFVADAAGTTAQGNISANSAADGFRFVQISEGDGPDIKNNLSVDNSADGFYTENTNFARFTGNSSVSSGDDAVDIVSGTFERFKNNNTVDSGVCGIENDSGTSLSYTNHFFGDVAGPNPPGSDDGVCGSDASTGSFSTKPNGFKAKTAAKL